MNKELEALDWIENVFEEHHVQLPDVELTLIRQALTPPTADEVCKALGEYLERDFYYDEKRKYFGDTDLTIICLMPEGKLYIAYMLPPHLITMIGKFYESLEETKIKESLGL